ncbi:MAG: hypothetical protein ACP5E2_09505 [Terracidiphilus sp.]
MIAEFELQIRAGLQSFFLALLFWLCTSFFKSLSRLSNCAKPEPTGRDFFYFHFPSRQTFKCCFGRHVSTAVNPLAFSKQLAARS